MSFKHSGVEWIGTIPSHWKISKIKYQTYINKQTLSDQTAEDYIIQYIDIGNVNSEGKIQELQEYKFSDAPSRARRIVKKNDLLISTVRTYLKAITSILDDVEDNMICSTGFAVLTPRETMDPLYLHYLSRSEMYIDEIVSRSTGVSYPAINASDIGALECILPPLDEQQIIGKFLHEKSSEVESIIQSKLKYIELLEQQRQSIITEAVTKGLNPNAKMKDSGVEWIGEIPEHWELSKIGYLGRLQNGISKSSEEFGFGTPFISYGDVYKNEVLPKNASGLVNATEEDKKLYSVNYGDVFFTRTSETIEEIGFASTCLETIPDATFAGFLIRFRPTTNRLNPYFSRFYFRSALGKRYFVKEMNLVTRASLAQGLLRNFTVVLPSLEEQEDIAVYLENKTTAIEESIALIKAQIEKLKEYRQSLIYEAVTGKIDVRDMELD